MDYFEIGFLVAFATISFGIFYAYRRTVRLEKERQERVMREIEENNERIRRMRAERRSSMMTRVEETKDHRRRFNDDRTMLYSDDSGAEILTQMILQQALNSSSDTVSGTVTWNNDTPTITSYSSSDSSSYSSSDSGSSSSSCD